MLGTSFGWALVALEAGLEGLTGPGSSESLPQLPREQNPRVAAKSAGVLGKGQAGQLWCTAFRGTLETVASACARPFRLHTRVHSAHAGGGMARSARCPLPGGSWPLLLLIWAAGTADHAPAAGAAAHLSRKCSPSERALILHPPSVGRAQRAVDRCSAGVSPAKDPRHLPVRLRGGGQENNAGGWVLRGGGGPLDGATEPQVDFANEYAKMFGDFPVRSPPSPVRT